MAIRNPLVLIGGELKELPSGDTISSGASLYNEVFVAGTGFTAGSSTSITLARDYTDEVYLFVAFDGVIQGFDTYSLAGTTLTFDAAIPVDVLKIYVKTTTTALASSGGGSGASEADVAELQNRLLNAYNTDYLLHCEGANGSTAIVNSAVAANTLSVVGTATVSTAQSKFGTSSLYANGGGARIKPDSNLFTNYTTNDFTIEMFVRLSSLSGYQSLFTRTQSGIYGGGYNVYASGNLLKADISTDNSSYNVMAAGTGVMTVNTWHHVALVRFMGTFTLYLDGVVSASAVNTQTMLASTIPLCIGARNDGTQPATGYFDEIRVARRAIYTGAFTPPVAAFTN